MREPYRFRFFQAVRLLERFYPGRAAVGLDGPAWREAVRFRAQRGLSFPPSEISSIDLLEAEGEPLSMTVNFMGLTGPLGVLPYCYTELVVERTRAGDNSLAWFLDLFNNRLIALFYRAWRKHHLATLKDNGEGGFVDEALSALVGLGLEPLQNRHEFNDGVARYYAGLLVHRHRTVIGLERLLREFFREKVEVEQFQLRWLRMDPSDCSALGASNSQLGGSLIVGERVQDVQGKFRLRLGPLSFREYLEYQPDQVAFRTLSQLVRLYVDGEHEFDVQLVLRAEEVPETRLTSAVGEGARLGRFAWLKSRPMERDAEEAVFASEG